MSGYKTYIVGAASIVFALIGLFLGQLDGNAALQLIMSGAGMLALRHAITTSTQ